MTDRPFGDRVVGGEVLDRPVGADVDEQGVDLDEFARRLGFSALGKALGVTLAMAHAEAPLVGTFAQDRHGDDPAPLDEPLEDSPDGRS